MKFVLADGQEIIKIGYAKDQESRLTHQLQIDRDMPSEIRRVLPIPTSQAAIRIEKRLHARIKREHPGAIIDPAIWHGQIRVLSEIYDSKLLSVVTALLDAVEAELRRDVKTPSTGRRASPRRGT